MAKKMVTEDRATSKKLSSNYFRRSVLNCLQNYIDHKENNEMIEKDKKKTKFHHDYTPVTFEFNLDLSSSEKQRKNQR